MAKGKQQAFEQDPADMARESQRDRAAARFVVDGKDVTQVRYTVKLDPERMNPEGREAERGRQMDAAEKSAIESADVRFFKGRKEVAAFVGLTADELDRLVGKHNRSNMENGVGQSARNQPIDGIAGKLEKDYLVSNRAVSAGLEDKAVNLDTKQSMTAALGDLDQITAKRLPEQSMTREAIGELVKDNLQAMDNLRDRADLRQAQQLMTENAVRSAPYREALASELAQHPDAERVRAMPPAELRRVVESDEKLFDYTSGRLHAEYALEQAGERLGRLAKMSDAEREKDSHQNIVQDYRGMMAVPANELPRDQASQIVRDNVLDLKSIQDPDLRKDAATYMDWMAHEQKEYRDQLQARDPVVAAEVVAAGEVLRAAQKAADSERVNAIVQRMENGLNRAAGHSFVESAEWARKDAQALVEINDPQRRQFATLVMAGVAQEKPDYMAVLLSKHGDIARQVEQANKDRRVDEEVAKFEHGLETGRITIDRAAGLDAGRGPSGKVGTILSDEQVEKYFREYEDQVRPGAARAAGADRAGATAERGAQNGDLSEVNSIEPDRDREQVHPKMDDEVRRNVALMWLNRTRQTDADRVAAADPSLQQRGGLIGDSERVAAADPSLPRNANRMSDADRVVASDPSLPGARKADQIPKEIEDAYLRVGNKFHYTDKPKLQAFEDKGERLETKSNSEKIAADLVAIANARGWDSIKVRGSEEFRQKVWLEASLQGMAVKGYKPTEADRALLEKRERESTSNAILRDDSVQKRLAPSVDIGKGATDREQGSTSAERSSATTGMNKPAQSTSADRATPAEREAPAPAKHERGELAGVLLEHGKAKFNFDKDEKSNYYVKYRDDKGAEQITWGVGLEKAMKESKADIGQRVELKNLGPEPVVVLANVRDASGNVIGKKEIETHRNKWEVKAEAFRNQDPKEVVKAHPDLVNAYAVMRAGEIVAAQKFQAPDDQKKFVEMMKESVAKSIEQNRAMPEVRIRETQQQAAQQKREIAAEKALER